VLSNNVIGCTNEGKGSQGGGQKAGKGLGNRAKEPNAGERLVGHQKCQTTSQLENWRDRHIVDILETSRDFAIQKNDVEKDER